MSVARGTVRMHERPKAWVRTEHKRTDIMDAPTLQPKFLANGTDMGLVAVGFSGGQVSTRHIWHSRQQ